MPHMKFRALTTGFVKRATKLRSYSDGYGLTLRIDARGNKRWVQRLTIRVRQRNLGLGSWPSVSLDEAREMALANWREAREGRDPIREKRTTRVNPKMPSLPTFEDVARRVKALRRPTWSSEKHADQWESSLKTYVFPVIGHALVDGVTTTDVLAILEHIWNAKPETATRVRQRMEVVFDYSIASGWRTDNPAVAVRKVLPRRRGQKKHHPAMPYGELPAFLQTLRASTADTVTKLGLEFLILTAARTGEVHFMEWGEVDTEAATWTVPAARMKARREHRVPLSRRALGDPGGGPEPWHGNRARVPVAEGEAPQQHGLHHAPPTAQRRRCRPARLSVDLQGLDAGTDHLLLGRGGNCAGPHPGIGHRVGLRPLRPLRQAQGTHGDLGYALRARRRTSRDGNSRCCRSVCRCGEAASGTAGFGGVPGGQQHKGPGLASCRNATGATTHPAPNPHRHRLKALQLCPWVRAASFSLC